MSELTRKRFTLVVQINPINGKPYQWYENQVLMCRPATEAETRPELLSWAKNGEVLVVGRRADATPIERRLQNEAPEGGFLYLVNKEEME